MYFLVYNLAHSWKSGKIRVVLMQKTSEIHKLTSSQRSWYSIGGGWGNPWEEPVGLLSSSSINIEQTQVTSLCMGD